MKPSSLLKLDQGQKRQKDMNGFKRKLNSLDEASPTMMRFVIRN